LPVVSPGLLALLVAGLLLLLAGAEAFVRGASRIAAVAGIPPLVVGLTVVSFGTSSPEIAVSLQSALTGSAELALGNVVGSNICNVLLVLGLSAAMAPLVVAHQLVRLDVPVLIGVSVLVAALGYDGSIARVEGLLLLAGALGYTAFLVAQTRRAGPAAVELAPHALPAAAGKARAMAVNLVLVAGGLALLVLGSRWLVSAAVSAAQLLGVSELVIGLTVIALGTSLPEVATSVIAMVKGESDIAVGNVVGSNIFNLLLVLGTSAAVAPGGIPVAPAVLRFDFPVMIAVAIACLPIFFTGHRIDRWEGFLFLGYYAAYAAYLVLASSGHAALPVFSAVMALFVIPLTAVTLAVVGVRAWRRHRRTAG
jgi:cation:H+ antiporter